jgi:hypothetical protein
MDEISERTVCRAVEVFENNLMFAFVGGSRAKGSALPDSDVDIFVLLDVCDHLQERQFAEDLRNLHGEGGLRFEHCGEIFSRSTLLSLLTMTEYLHDELPSLSRSPCYLGDCIFSIYRKGLVVFDFLSKPKISVHDPGAYLNYYEQRAEQFDTRRSDKFPAERRNHVEFSKGSLRHDLYNNFQARSFTADWVDTPIGVGLERWFEEDVVQSPSVNVTRSSQPDLESGHLCPAEMGLSGTFLNQCLAHLGIFEVAENRKTLSSV